MTPASSLGSPAVTSDTEEADKRKPRIDDETEFRKRIYETYSIQLSDMQVIVGRLKDNWRQAQMKGSSSLHVLDKFSISLQLDRLLVSSNDDSLPKFALSGTLPKLSAHINEDKVRKKCKGRIQWYFDISLRF